MEWRPIETAPKDGKDILLWSPRINPKWDDVVFVAGWFNGSWVAVSGATWAEDEVTHWMPLPKPPLSASE